jgi:hypothetical protein
MARRKKSPSGNVTRRDRAGSGGSTAAARANQDGRFGGAAASRSRGEQLSRQPGAGRRGYDSQNAEQRATARRRTREPQWQKETQSARPAGEMQWYSATELVDSAETRRAPKAEDKPGPSGRRGTRGQGGWENERDQPAAQRRPKPGDPSYEAHSDVDRPRARGRGDDSARERTSRRGASVMDSGVGRRGAAGSLDEQPAPSNRRSQQTRKFERA